MSTKATFVEIVKAKIIACKADVDRLQARAAGLDPAQIGPYTAAIQKILAKIQQIEKQFTDGSQGRTGTWQELKRSAESSFAQIDSLVKEVDRRYLS